MLTLNCRMLTTVALALLLSQASTDRLLANNQFFVLSFESLSQSAQSWPEGPSESFRQFSIDNAAEIGSLRYLIIPKFLLPPTFSPDGEAAETSRQSWGVYEIELGTSSSNDVREYLRPIGLSPGLRTAIAKAIAEKDLEGSESDDIMILDENEQEELSRLVWLNRSPSSLQRPCQDNTRSTFTDSISVLRRFDCEFFGSLSRRWFLSPQSANKILIVTGLRTGKKSRIYAYIPDHVGPQPSLEAYYGDQELLANTIRILRAQDIPATLIMSVEGVDLQMDERRLDSLLSELSIYFIGEESEIVAHFNERDFDAELEATPGRISLSGSLPRNILKAKKLKISLPGSRLQFLIEGELATDVEFELPSGDGVTYKGFPQISVAVTRAQAAGGLKSPSLWRHQVDFGDIDLEGNWSSLEAVEHLDSYVQSDSGDSGLQIPILKLRANRSSRAEYAKRLLRAEFSAIKGTLDALWDNIVAAKWAANGEVEVLLIVNTAGPSTSIESRRRIRQHTDFLKSFLIYKMKKISKAPLILESERVAPSQKGTIELIFIPTNGTNHSRSEMRGDDLTMLKHYLSR